METLQVLSIFTWIIHHLDHRIVSLPFLQTHTHTHAPFWSYDNLVGDYFILYRNLKNLEQWFSALAARITQAPPPEFYLIGLWWSPSNIISLKLIKCSQYSTRVVGHGPRAIVLQQALKDLQKHRLLTPKFLIQ